MDSISHEIDGEEYEIEIEYKYTYRPAKIDGPPEECHPDESELEYWIKSITPEPNAIHSMDIDEWVEYNQEIEDKCIEDYFSDD